MRRRRRAAIRAHSGEPQGLDLQRERGGTQGVDLRRDDSANLGARASLGREEEEEEDRRRPGMRRYATHVEPGASPTHKQWGELMRDPGR